MATSPQQAHDIATRILIAMAERPDDLVRFLEGAGLQPSDLRAFSDRPDMALFLLDFLVEEDNRLCDFADVVGMRPQDIMSARTALSGPGSYGWSAD
ncbi:DUF3572 family protein [Paracoccus beibuensis]|uniref:DUF3572 family protein n=1 Tax=Paracoccus beibuensis TaxID=547602 RepID=UPI00223FBB15|nr:DUF3572 family protein [Paracoccus beibuensis]